MKPPLLITRDPILLEEFSRLAAAAGITPEVVQDVGAALRSFSGAALVLLGADLLTEVARMAPPRRAGVHVLCWGEAPAELFRTALAVGAEEVAELPDSSAWLTECLTDLGEARSGRALTVGVMGGSGGAGATTFACALAQVAARHGTALVIDVDPLGPGLDRVLGLESVDGVRWEALGRTTGRLGARALRESLPRRDGLAALTWRPGLETGVQAFAAREAISAGQRGHDLVVLDLPRSTDPLSVELWARCDHLLLVVAATMPGVASAHRLCHQLPRHDDLRLVVRGNDIEPEQIARLVGAPVAVAMSDQRRLAESVDLGLGPVRSPRGPLGRAASETLRRLLRVGGAT